MKRVCWLIVGMAITTAVFAKGSKRKIKKGDKFYQKGQYAQAIPYYEAAVATDSASKAILRLAESHLFLAHYEEALHWYRIAERKNILQDIDYYNYGVALKATEHYKEAKKAFERYLKRYPDDPIAKMHLRSCEFVLSQAHAPIRYKVRKVEGINSPYSDFAAFPYQNGLIFVSSRPESKGGAIDPKTGEHKTDLFYAPLIKDDVVGKIQPFLPPDLNTIDNEGPISITADGSRIYFSRTEHIKANPDLGIEETQVLQIYEVRRLPQGWSPPYLLPFNGRTYSCAHPAVFPDGKRLIYVSDHPDGYGQTDLYIVERLDDGVWSTPQNLGDGVNTPGREMFPFVLNDTTLYFASDYHPGYGGLDIFEAKLRNGKWVVTRNLGKEINSAADDFALVFIDKKATKGYLSSNRKGSQSDDIYFVFLIRPEKEEKAPRVVIVQGKVLERIAKRHGDNWSFEKGAPLSRAIVALTKGRKTIQKQYTDADGSFSFRIEENGDYTLIVMKDNHFIERIHLPIRTLDSHQALKKEVYLERILLNVPNTPRLANIYFDFDRYTLRPEARQQLQKIIAVLKDNPHIRLEVAGHACPIGPAAYNQVLSEKRAKAAYDYLIQNGIAKERLSYKGYGETRPIVKDPKQYHWNRRVEFIVKDAHFTPEQMSIK